MNQFRSGALAAVAGAVAVSAALRPAPQDEVAPFLSPGRNVYGLVLDEPDGTRSLPEVGFVEPIKIVGVRGHWALLEVRGQTRGPVWVNFDQVVSYRTDP